MLTFCILLQQGADADLLCELCWERGLQASPAGTALSQIAHAVSQALPTANGRHQVPAGSQGAGHPAMPHIISPQQEKSHAKPPLDSFVGPPHDVSATGMAQSSSAGQDNPCSGTSNTDVPQQAGRRRLRILCLHGFRQSASSLKGRTAALARKLSDLAELVFVDAPHPVPFVIKQQPTCQQDPCHGGAPEQECHSSAGAPCQNEGSSLRTEQDSASIEASLRHISSSNSHGEAGAVSLQTCSADAQHAEALQGPHVNNSQACQTHLKQRQFRRAWLLEPQQVPVSQVSPLPSQHWWHTPFCACQVNVKQEELSTVLATCLRHPNNREASVQSFAARHIFVTSQHIISDG